MIKFLKIALIVFVLLFVCIKYSNAQFTPGNIVVERLGDATHPGGNAAATPIYLDEYTTSGILVQSVAMPTTATLPNYKLVESGSAAKSALMTRSYDGQYLCVTGFADTLGDPNVSSSSTTGAYPVARVIGRVDYNGNVNTTTALRNYSGNKIRGVASLDGTQFWTSGNGGPLAYMALGFVGTAPNLMSTPTNENALEIFNGQLYFSANSSSWYGIFKAGTGLPTTTCSWSTVLSNSLYNPFQFQWLVLSPGDTVLYLACQAGSLGFAKFSLVNGSLVLNSNIPGSFVGLTGTVNCAGYAELFYSNASTTSNPGYRFIDSSGFNASFNTYSGVNPSQNIPPNPLFFNKAVAFAPAKNYVITGTQNLSAGSYGNITINNGGVVTLTGDITMVGTLTINNGGTLICGNHIVLGNPEFQNAFVLNAGGTLDIGSPAGITANAAAGNIQTCARVYSTAANYVFNGNTNQVTGDGFPLTSNKLTIANTGAFGNNTVTLYSSLSITNEELYSISREKSSQVLFEKINEVLTTTLD